MLQKCGSCLCGLCDVLVFESAISTAGVSVSIQGFYYCKVISKHQELIFISPRWLERCNLVVVVVVVVVLAGALPYRSIISSAPR